jgi:sugar O-acyltransferase (sialic acid O-acetyltransferase NeuD family)
MTGRLIIVGAGGHGREALAVARAANRRRDRWHTISLADDGTPAEDTLERVDAELVGDTQWLINNGDEHVIAIGDPSTRRSIAERIGRSAPAVALVDPSAWLGDDVILDDGAMLYPGAICTTNVRIGHHSHVNCGVIVSHDCRVGDFVSLSPGVRLNGDVTIKDGAFLGTGAVVLPGRTVGQGAVVGAGAVVVDDVAPATTVIGVPAR